MLVLWTVLLCVAPARASADPIDQLRATMEEGQSLYLAGKYADAARVFEAGFAVNPYPAFLFNAGVCYQKSGRPDAALRAFRLYLEKDPQAPDAADVRGRIASLEEGQKGPGVEGPSQEPEAPPSGSEQGAMKSLVVVETDPPGAPLRVYRQSTQRPIPFVAERSQNPGWELVKELTAPAQLTLAVGRYHVVVEKFREFNRSETDIEVSPGHVHHFKANLSQGAFMGFLKVSSNVVGALVFLDDAAAGAAPWGQVPHGELLKPGKHQIRVEAPGYQPSRVEVEVLAGDKQELLVELERVSFGIVRLDATASTVDVYEGAILLGTWRQGQPALEMRLPAGSHQLVIKTRGYKELVTFVDVPRGQILPVRAQMVEKVPRGAAWTQAILGAAVIGTSIYFGAESDRLAGELAAERATGTLASGDPRIDQGYWYSIGADAGFGLGGLLGLLSVYNFVKDPYPDPELRRGKKLEFKGLGTPPEQATPRAVEPGGTR